MTRRSPLPCVALWPFLAVALAGCDDPRNPAPKYRLEGSLSQVMNLGYDEARIRVAAQDVSVSFVRIRPLAGIADDAGVTNPNAMGTREDTVLSVAWRILNDPLPADRTTRLDLAALDSNMVQRGSVSRNVFNDPRTTFPPLERGSMAFDRPLDPDVTVIGDLHLTFENGVEVASGRTVFLNSFTATVQQ